MASKIILKKSNVTTKAPAAGDLDYGELALNYTDGKLYYKTNADVVAVLNAGDVTGAASSTDNAIARFDGTTGKIIQNSAVYIDDSGNLGVGTSSPSTKLNIVGSSQTIALIKGGASANQGASYFIQQAGSSNTLAAFGDRACASGGTPDQAVGIYTASGVPLVFDISGAEKMRLDASGNLGVGTSSPSQKLDVLGKISTVVAGGGTHLLMGNSYATVSIGSAQTAGLDADLTFYTQTSTERMRLDASGNLGLGVTPSAWSSAAGSKALQIGDGGVSLLGGGSGWSSEQYMYLSNNAYHNSGAWKYLRSVASAQYVQFAGQHQWFNASSGTAGTAITFTQAMTLDASGNLGVGTSSPSARLHVSGANAAGGFGAILSNTNATGFASLELSDGTVTKAQIWAGNASYATYGGAGSLNYTANSGPHVWYNNYVERMRLDASGNLSIGTNTSTGKLSISGISTGSTLVAATFANTGLTSGSTVRVNFLSGEDGTVGRTRAIIEALAPATNDGALVFSVRSAGTTAERMRIGATGNVTITGTLAATNVSGTNTGDNPGVTSVAPLTLGTSGTDVSSTVATGTTTPVITLNIPTASATNRGALSAADWTTFNNKQAAGSYLTAAVTSITAGTGLSGGTITTSGTIAIDATVATLTGTQNLQNKTLVSPVISGSITEGVFTITDGASVDLDPSNGTIQLWTLGANRTATAAGFAAGEAMTLMIADGAAYSLAFPTMTWANGTVPVLATTGYTVVELWKVGSTLYGAVVGDVA